jgi:tol-pal system protein YbgF
MKNTALMCEKKVSLPTLLVLAIGLGSGVSVWAESVPAQLSVPPSVVSDMMSRQQQMQQELAELRGLVERQGYELEMLKRGNKEVYMDTDQRLRVLETGSHPSLSAQQAATVAPPQAGAAPAAAAVVTTQPPLASTAPASTVDNAADQAKYDQGLRLLKAGEYAQAIKMFDQVIKSNPPSPNVPNARYWTGEAYVVLGDLKSALASFERVVQDSPAHQKAADAQLKIGYIYYDQKNYPSAREVLNKVKAQYPGTQAATLAEQRLKRMQAEGV